AIMTNGPGAVPLPPVRRLAAAGVTVFAGSVNIRDAWSPYGNGDLLDRVRHIGYLNAFLSAAALALAVDLAIANAARVLGFADQGIAPGRRADVVVVDAASIAEAVAAAPPRRLVVKAGRVVARDGRLVAT